MDRYRWDLNRPEVVAISQWERDRRSAIAMLDKDFPGEKAR